MSSVEQVIVTLPADLVADMDSQATDRNAFVAEAVGNELLRRRRGGLELSLRNPNPDSVALAEEGLDDWAKASSEEDVESLVDWTAVRRIRWVPGEGWAEEQD